MSLKKPDVEQPATYDSKTAVASFDFKFNIATEITGYMKLHMWVEAPDHHDIDLFIYVQKVSTDGKWIPMKVMGYEHPGAWGKLRVSRRELDPELSTDFLPILKHQKEEKLKPG